MQKHQTPANVAKAAATDTKTAVQTPKTAIMQVTKGEQPGTTPAEAQKPAEIAPKPEQPPVKKEVSVQDMLAKVNELNSITKKLNYLQAIKTNLAGFSLGVSGVSDSLTIKDGNGNDFLTTNTEIITKVVALLKKEVAIKVEDTEADLRAAM